MNLRRRASNMLAYIYEEGDIDIILFSQILGMVSYGDDDIPLGKTQERRINDALDLVDYLVATRDFYIGETIALPDGSCKEDAFDGSFESFCFILRDIFEKDGINDVRLNFGFWLKKVNIHKQPPDVPKEILSLFGK